MLFQQGNFRLASGQQSWWKLDCDGLTDEDWAVLARLAVEIHPWMQSYTPTGVATGGEPFAAALEPYCTPSGPPLVVDDVITTGGSIERVRREIGELLAPALVAFQRGEPRIPNVIALWKLGG